MTSERIDERPGLLRAAKMARDTAEEKERGSRGDLGSMFAGQSAADLRGFADRLEYEAAAQQSAPQAPTDGAGWQPIDTLPADLQDAMFGGRDLSGDPWVEKGYRRRDGTWCHLNNYGTPTHWRPAIDPNTVPAAPTPDQGSAP